MTEIVFAAYILVMAGFGGAIVIPQPYSSKDACVAAVRELSPTAQEGTGYVCVPVEDSSDNG